MKNNMTLGSLFDGSGGFALGGILCGIRPIWASEIEPFPIRVTTKRIPFMKHYGDINKISGAKIEPVDIITFGSPCTDLSIAGKRAGLKGQQSSLFYEAIRIIKEMRRKTNGKYPRYCLWENVPGAFSSGKGEDFRCVLEEICRIKDEKFFISKPEKWSGAGEIVGEEFSVAWRVFNAEHWGVPQRRKRIYLVTDFGGESAGKILFEFESMPGYSAKKFYKWQKISNNTEDDFGKPSNVSKIFKIYRVSKSGTFESEISKTIDLNGLNPCCNQGGMIVITRQESDKKNDYFVRRLTPTECGRLQGFPDSWCKNLETKNPSKKDIEFWRKIFNTHRKIMGRLKQKTENQIIKWLKNPHSDTAEYKMWGNGAALPNIYFVLSGIVYFARN